MMERCKYAFNILVVSDGIYSIIVGGLQADLKGVWGGRSPTREKHIKNIYDLS